MNTKRLLSALCYFSIMFAGILFPLITYFASEDQEVKGHAKKAFLSHLIPLIPLPLLLFAIYLDISGGQADFPIFAFSGGIAMAILGLIVLIWNLVKGIKVLS